MLLSFMPAGEKNDPLNALLLGDRNLFNLLYDRLLPKVIQYVKSNNGSAEDGEEVFQEVISRLVIRAKTGDFRINTSLSSYVYIACRNQWINEAKKRTRYSRNQTLDALRDESSEAVEPNPMYWQLIEDKFDKLSENCQELLKDYLNKMPYDELTFKYQYATMNTAFQRIFKCKKKLMELVKSDARFLNL